MSNFLEKLRELFKSKDKSEDKGKEENKKKASGANFLNNVLIIFLIGVLLVIVGSMFKPSKTNVNTSGATAVSSVSGQQAAANGDSDTTAVTKEYKEKMQDELVETLGKIQGVGKVHAMIYFSSGTEQVPVFDEDTSKSVTNEEDTNGGKRNITQENGGSKVVMENENNSEKPFITKTKNPTISGICVVAEGADDSVTELRIRQAVISVYGLEDSKVQVYPMEK